MYSMQIIYFYFEDIIRYKNNEEELCNCYFVHLYI